MDRLVSFVCLAEELHFGRAAALLHLSQPALSQQIAKLEGRLGASLLVRGARTVRLTHAGRVMLRACRQVLTTMDQAVGTIRADLAVGPHILLVFDTEQHRGYATALATEISRVLGVAVTPSRTGAAELAGLLASGRAYAGVTTVRQAVARSEEIVVEVVGSDPYPRLGAPPAQVALAWPRWASRVESARLVEAGHSVWRDLMCRVA